MVNGEEGESQSNAGCTLSHLHITSLDKLFSYLSDREKIPLTEGGRENSNSFYVSFSSALSCSFSFPLLIEEHKNKNHFSLCRWGWDSVIIITFINVQMAF